MTNYSLEVRKAEIEKITKSILQTLEQNPIISVTDGITILDVVKSYMPIYKKMEEKVEMDKLMQESIPVECGCGCGCSNEEPEDEYEEDVDNSLETAVADIVQLILEKIIKK